MEPLPNTSKYATVIKKYHSDSLRVTQISTVPCKSCYWSYRKVQRHCSSHLWMCVLTDQCQQKLLEYRYRYLPICGCCSIGVCICWQVYSTSFTYYIYCLQKENIEPQKQRCSTRSGQQLEQPTTSRSTCRTRTVKQLQWTAVNVVGVNKLVTQSPDSVIEFGWKWC